jgi:hypothetical protein
MPIYNPEFDIPHACVTQVRQGVFKGTDESDLLRIGNNSVPYSDEPWKQSKEDRHIPVATQKAVDVDEPIFVVWR